MSTTFKDANGQVVDAIDTSKISNFTVVYRADSDGNKPRNVVFIVKRTSSLGPLDLSDLNTLRFGILLFLRADDAKNKPLCEKDACAHDGTYGSIEPTEDSAASSSNRSAAHDSPERRAKEARRDLGHSGTLHRRGHGDPTSPPSWATARGALGHTMSINTT